MTQALLNLMRQHPFLSMNPKKCYKDEEHEEHKQGP